MNLTPVAYIHSPFTEKFGIPRQSGLVEEIRARLVFEPDYRMKEAFRGLEGFSHIWLIWEFTESRSWSPTVRPPRLGGNRREGVFATRSPFRPNPLGLSCVKLEGIDWDTPRGPVLRLLGADLLDGTPVYDVKPYIPTDCHPEASGGFVTENAWRELRVEFPGELLDRVPAEHRAALLGALAQDPRPRYQEDPDRVYGMSFAGVNVRFTVTDGVLTVRGVDS